MLNRDIFEALLTTYPAERRELARQAFHRFAEADSGQFFTQLFLLLDVYAHYAERVPEAVMEANQNAHVGLSRIREEIGLLAQTMEKRDLSITNQAEKTEEVCHEAIAKCDETLARFEAVLKNVGAGVNTQAIVAGIEQAVQEHTVRDVIMPFLRRSLELTERVTPTLQEICELIAKANRLWPARIWRTAILGSLTLTLALSVLATIGISMKLKHDSEKAAVEKIASVARLMNYNQDAFRDLAVAQVQVKVVRAGDSDGVHPGGFALMLANADSADMRQVEGRDTGMIFFTSRVRENEIQQMKQEFQKLTNAATGKSK